MRSRTLTKLKNKDSATLAPVFVRKPSDRSFYQGAANEAREVSNPGFGHNFGEIQVVGPCFKHTYPPRLQAKLKIGQPRDKYEQEADRVAERVMRMPEPRVQRKGCSSCKEVDEEELIQTKPVVGQVTPLIQRQELEPEEEEEEEVVQTKLLVHRQELKPEEEEEEEILQPKEVPGQTPAVTKDVRKNIRSLRGAGEPLSESERSFFERRFGRDFGRVRVHCGEQATRLTRAVNARAFTVDRDVVFGAGQFAAETPEGRRLLAHELTHVLQQQNSPGLQRCVLQRKGGTLGGFFRGLGRAIAGFFTGKELLYDEQTLQRYLKILDDSGDIEDDFDSDNKARSIVNAWKEGGSPYALTSPRKALLILELQSGFTGDDDERAILEILGRSYNFELAYIFGAGGVSARKLNSDFHTKEWPCLQNFYQRRFEGGMEAVLGGKVKPFGHPVALGESLPECSIPNALPGFPATWTVECLLGILCSQDKAIVARLRNLTVQKANFVTEVYWEYDGAQWVQKDRRRGAFSNVGAGIIGLKTTRSCAQAATDVIHEVRHHSQPTTWTTLEKERDAYTFEEDWSLRRGLPGTPRFRQRIKGTKREAVNPAAIEKFVEKKYSGIAATPGDQIIDHNAADETVVERPNGTEYTRPPQAGDSHQDVTKTKAKLAGLPKVDPAKWVCPKTN